MNNKRNIATEYPYNLASGLMDSKFSHSQAIDPIKSLGLKKLGTNLYSVNYDFIDYPAISTYMEAITGSIGRCSCARKGKWYGRNLDWFYDMAATFVVHTSKLGTRHASVGIGLIDLLDVVSDEMAEAGVWSPGYLTLPGTVVDGINDCGVACNVNVVPLGDMGVTLGTNPGAEDLCMMAVTRFVLDNASCAKDAIILLGSKNIFVPLKTQYDYHFMICDKDSTYIVEFPYGKMHVMSDQDDEYDMIPNHETLAMTNFYMTGWDGQTTTGFNVTGGISPEDTTLTAHSAGIERYDILKAGIGSVSSMEEMQDLMHSVFYTKMYKSDTNPFWYSEYATYWSIGEFTIYQNKSDFDEIIARAKAAYENRSRETGITWYTGHTSVYDLENKVLYLTNNEDTTNTYTINL